MRKKGNIVSYTAEELKSLIEQGGDQTDWAKVNATSEQDIEASILADPDDIQEHIDWIRAIRGLPPSKDHINIRVDHDVLEFLEFLE